MYGRPLTPEERMMRQILSRQNNPYGTPTTMESQVNAAVSAPMTPGTGGFGDPPVPTDLDRQAMAARTQDFTDRQSAVDSQREIAQQMRSGKSPQGRTVGPYDVYVAPNWGEVAGDVATKLGGGYLEGRANKEGAKIDEARSEAALQKAMEEQRRRTEDVDYRERGLADKAAARAEALAWRQEQEKIRQSTEAENLRRWEIQQANREEDDLRADNRLKNIEDKALQTETRQYSTALGKSGVPTLGTAIGTLRDTLEPFQTKDEDGNVTGYENIPGIGGLSNTEWVGGAATVLGDAYTGVTEPESDKPRGKDVRQAFQKVMNTVIVNEAGKAQTVQEALRQNRAAGFDMWADDKSFISGINTIEDLMRASEENVNRGFSQEARDAYASALEGDDVSVEDMTDEQLRELAGD